MNRGLKALYKLDKTYLNALHMAYGFDYNRPFYCEKIKGKFTINKLLKQIEDKGISPFNATIALVIRYNDDANAPAYRRYTYTVELSAGGTFKIDVNKTTSLDTFWRKSDFEEMRKSDLTTAWIIAQKNSDTRARHGKKWDEDKINFSENEWRERYKLEELNEYSSWGSDTKVIDSLTLRATDGTNKSGQFYDFKSYDVANKNALYDVIDKSGYIVRYRREYLKKEAEKLRKQREKDAVNATDKTASVNALKTRIDALKIMLSAQFEMVHDYESAKQFDDKIGYWNGLMGIYSDYERIIRYIDEKRFDSIAEFNNSVNALNKKISECLTA